MKKLDAVIFDLFGTLIDWMPDSLYIENSKRMTEVLGLSCDDFRRCWMEIGEGRTLGAYGDLIGNIRAACELAGCSPTNEALKKAADIRLEITRENLKPRKHAIESIKWLKDQGLKVALLSDISADTPEVWPTTEFAPFFDAAVFSCDVHVAKPDRKIYEHVLSLIEVQPENCLYIGDGGSNELTGAQAMGMHPVCIKIDYEEEYDARRPDGNWKGTVIRSLAEVPGLVREFGG